MDGWMDGWMDVLLITLYKTVLTFDPLTKSLSVNIQVKAVEHFFLATLFVTRYFSTLWKLFVTSLGDFESESDKTSLYLATNKHTKQTNRIHSHLNCDYETQSAFLSLVHVTHQASCTAHTHHKHSHQMVNEQSL